MTDIAIIGGGPAGLSAAINARIRNKTVLLVTNDYKDSYLAKAERVDINSSEISFPEDDFVNP